MGASASSSVQKNKLEEQGSPTVEDVYKLRRLLLTRIPAELANITSEYAQYWPKASCSFNADGKEEDLYILATYSNGNNATACPLVKLRLRDMLPSAVESLARVRRAHFKIESHDQGWGGEPNITTKYGGSWTWFTAVIVRQVEEAAPLIDGQTSVEDKIKNLLVENTSERTAAIGQDPKIVRVKNPVYDSYAWHIQRNVRAVGEHTKHEVVWTADASGSVPEERHIMDMKGAGSGVGFVQSLRMEDRIAVVARALYPGWSNSVRRVEIEVYFSI